MQTIYEPKGRAREYAELALNLYRGCSHGCTYCFARNIPGMTAEEFAKPVQRTDILNAVAKVADKFRNRNVFLCFSCDPYQPLNNLCGLTRRTIEILHGKGVNVRILTKGGDRSIPDFDLLTDKDAYGATLTFCNKGDSLEWEPYADTPLHRLNALIRAHDKGIYTWASLEPVIDPEQSLELITMTYRYVDEYKVGKWNHDSRADLINWKDFTHKAIALLEKYEKKYYIKNDLKRYL